MRSRLVALLMSGSLVTAPLVPAFAADDFKVMKLEQDVRNLERQVQDLQRQLAELQQRSRNAADQSRLGDSQPTAPQTNPTLWLDAANWKRVRPGMNELEVIALLGPPASMRGAADSGSRTLFYAMEIGTSGFLSGSVQLRDRVVTEVSAPVLR